MSDLTQSKLKKLLHYDPDTGYFTWLVRPANSVKIGDIAGTIENGYIQIKIDYKHYKAHRLAFLYMEGKFPEDGLDVDHVNHKPGDNRFSNLRVVTHQDNLRNSSMRKNNTSGHTGVTWDNRVTKWSSSIISNGKRKHLGYFDNKDEAIAVRKEAEVKYNFHENHGKQKIGEII